MQGGCRVWELARLLPVERRACCAAAAAAAGSAAAVAFLPAASLMRPLSPLLPTPAHPSQMGLDLIEGSIRDNVAAGVVEPALSKTKIIQFATEAVRARGRAGGGLGWAPVLHPNRRLMRMSRVVLHPCYDLLPPSLPAQRRTPLPAPAGHHHPAHRRPHTARAGAGGGRGVRQHTSGSGGAADAGGWADNMRSGQALPLHCCCL